MSNPTVLFFDIGNTLAVSKLAPNGSLDGLTVFPFVAEILGKLKVRSRLGILSNTGTETKQTMNRVLREAHIDQFFEPGLLLFSSVEGMDKRNKKFFERAVLRSGVLAARCVYISEDLDERNMAESAGLRSSFHPLHVFHVVDQLV